MALLEIDRDRTNFDFTKLFPVLLLLLTVLLYLNTLPGPFIFDDHDHFIKDPSVDEGWLPDPSWFGSQIRRPVFKWSIMVNKRMNEAIWGPDAMQDTQLFHLFNIAIHVAAVLALYGLIRRTLWLPKFEKRFGDRASYLAMAIAVLWAVHPLQTQSVAYLVQRVESMMGLFFLLTFYCFVRGAAGGSKGWYLPAILACALGMATKEVMVVAPLLLLLYDRAFIADGFKAALKARWYVYAVLFLPMVAAFVIAVPIIFSSNDRLTAGLGSRHAPLDYLFTQFGVILHYIRLSVLPIRLNLDYYDWGIEQRVGVIFATGAAVGALVAVTVWGLIRNTWWGFVGAWFFLILAPTSTILPINDLVMEHRMYLPLAAVLLLAVFGADWLLRTAATRDENVAGARPMIGLAVVLMFTAWLSITTVVRNFDYLSEEAFYRSILDVRPNNMRAKRNLASVLGDHFEQTGDIAALEEASDLLRDYLEYRPGEVPVRLALGRMMMDMGRTEAALAEFNYVLNDNPTDPDAHYQIGWGYFNARNYTQAIERFEYAMSLNPTDPRLLANINTMHARSLIALGEQDRAVEFMSRVLREYPALTTLQVEYGVLMLNRGNREQAYDAFLRALRADPDNIEAATNLGTLYLEINRTDDAIQYLTHAARLANESPDPAQRQHLKMISNNLGQAYAMRNRPGDLENAYRLFENVVVIDRDHADAWSNIGNVMNMLGRPAEAGAALAKAVQLDPSRPEYARRLAWFRATTWDEREQDGDEAVRLAESANDATGGRSTLYLHTLAAAYARAGRFEDAAEAAYRAAERSDEAGNAPFAEHLRELARQFEAGEPLTNEQVAR